LVIIFKFIGPGLLVTVGFIDPGNWASNFAAGSMGPKVQAVINFVKATGKDAAIGSLAQIQDIVAGKAGTRVTNSVEGLEFY